MAKIKARQIDTGTGANQLVELDGSGDYPASNGSAITNVDADTLGGQPVGTGANDIVALNGSSQLPAVDASLLTDIPYEPATIYTDSGNHILVLSNAGNYIRMTNGSSSTLTVPTNASVAFEIGTEIDIHRAAGTVTVVASGGVTVNTAETLILRKTHSTATLIYVGSDVWDLVGDLQFV